MNEKKQKLFARIIVGILVGAMLLGFLAQALTVFIAG